MGFFIGIDLTKGLTHQSSDVRSVISTTSPSVILRSSASYKKD